MVGYAIHSKRPLHIYYADAKGHLPMTSVMVAKWSPNARENERQKGHSAMHQSNLSSFFHYPRHYLDNGSTMEA